MTQTVSYISLSELLSQNRAPESIVCFDDNSEITWQTFNDDLSQLVTPFIFIPFSTSCDLYPRQLPIFGGLFGMCCQQKTHHLTG